MSAKKVGKHGNNQIVMHGMPVVTGIILAPVLYPEDTNASILAGIDEPTGNAYDDAFGAEAENDTFTLESNQTTNENNTDKRPAY